MSARTKSKHILQDYAGQPIQFVQIGLGTNSTFIQNLTASPLERSSWNNSIEWIMDLCSVRLPNEMKGISVEPVSALAHALREKVRSLPHMALVEVAMGSVEADCVELWVFDQNAIEDMEPGIPSTRRAYFRLGRTYVLESGWVFWVGSWAGFWAGLRACCWAGF